MARKDAVSVRLPLRRGLSEIEAASYLSISRSFFRRLVDEGRMPRPRLAGKRRILDIEEIDSAFRDLPREGTDGLAVPENCGDNTWADYE